MVGRSPLARLLIDEGGVQLHMCICASLFVISGTVARLALEFDMCLHYRYLFVLRVLRAKNIARAHPFFVISIVAGRFLLKFVFLLDTPIKY